MISHQHRCIFIHIPKCAGSSVEQLVWPGPRTEAELWMGFVDEFHNRHQIGGLQHLLARQVRTEVGAAVYAEYLTFAIVRNPWDKAVSQFHFMSTRPDLRRFLGLDADASFSRYLQLIGERQHVQWMPQVDFINDEAGNVMVDVVLRYEALSDDLPALLERLSVPWPGVLPHLKRSDRDPDHRVYYTHQDRLRVEHLYAADIDQLGYAFG